MFSVYVSIASLDAPQRYIVYGVYGTIGVEHIHTKTCVRSKSGRTCEFGGEPFYVYHVDKYRQRRLFESLYVYAMNSTVLIFH